MNKAILVSFLLGLTLHANAEAIKLHNLTSFDDDSIVSEMNKRLPKEFLAGLSDGKLTVVAYTDHTTMEYGTYCFSFVGLAHTAPKGLNPRMPKSRFMSISSLPPGEKVGKSEINSCNSDALLSVIDSFGKAPWPDQLEKARKTSGGGSRKTEPKDYEIFRHFEAADNIDDVSDGVKALVEKTDFSDAFDYRQIEIATLSTFIESKGKLVCYSASGLSMAPPTDRTPRIPGMLWTRFYVKPIDEIDKGLKDQVAKECEVRVAKEAVSTLLNQSWDKNGILKHLSLAREEDLPLVTAARSKPKTAAPTKTAKANTGRDCRPRTSSLRCQSNCVNGNCVVTYENGCKINIQVNSKYNAFTNQWEYPSPGC